MPETINSLIKAIKKKNDQENSDCQWILLVDELIAQNGDDFTSFCIIEDVDVLIGVSPNSGSDGSVFEVILPNNKRIIAKRLVFKHRNSLELNVFLVHLNVLFSKEDMYTPLSNDNDMPLIESCFPAIDKVSKISKWIQKNQYSFLINFSHRTLSKEEIQFGFWPKQIYQMLRSLKPSKLNMCQPKMKL